MGKTRAGPGAEFRQHVSAFRSARTHECAPHSREHPEQIESGPARMRKDMLHHAFSHPFNTHLLHNFSMADTAQIVSIRQASEHLVKECL